MVSAAHNISDSGALTVAGISSFTTTANNGAINLTQGSAYTGDVYLNTNGTGNATLTNTTIALQLNTSTIGGNLSVSSAGNITNSGVLALSGTGTFATTVADKNISLSQANTYGGNLLFTTTRGAGLAGNVTISGTSSAIALGTSNIGGDLSVTTSNTSITNPGILTVGGNTSFAANGNNASILIDNTSNNMSGTVSLTSTGSLANVSIANTPSISIPALSVISGNLIVISKHNISDTAALNVGGTSSFTTTANNGVITLNKASTYTGAISLNTNGTGNASLTNVTTAINVAASTVGGNLTIVSPHTISDSGPISVGGTATFTTIANNAPINLTQASTYTGAVYLTTNGAGNTSSTGNATLTNVASALNVGASTVGGNLNISAAHTISDSGVISVAGTSSFSTTANNASINLTEPSAYTGDVHLNTNGSGNATLINNTLALQLNTSTVGGNLHVSSAGNITNTGVLAITGTGTFATTVADKNISLTQANTYGGNLLFTTTRGVGGAGNVSINGTSSAIALGTANIGGDLSVTTSNSNITSPGMLTVGGNASFAANGLGASILINNANNNMSGNLSVTSLGSLANVSIANTPSISIPALSPLSGNLTIVSKHNISDTAPLIVGGTSSFTTSANNGTINLSQGGTYSGPMSLNTNGTGSATVVGVINPLLLNTSTIGGDLNVNVLNTIADVGPIYVGGNASYVTSGSNPISINLSNASYYNGTVLLGAPNGGDIIISNITSNLNLAGPINAIGNLTVWINNDLYDNAVYLDDPETLALLTATGTVTVRSANVNINYVPPPKTNSLLDALTPAIVNQVISATSRPIGSNSFSSITPSSKDFFLTDGVIADPTKFPYINIVDSLNQLNFKMLEAY